ncbi:LuxR C-terminal-related transcriptional regulator [Thiomicrorhabdus sp. Kp2]|uniref:helix-turn-helix transcriptional regulator n=1 Tax=Thiomicrorhabdus sp. Kp2 TaxID=1123518 RepID=UPI0003FF6289|nr:LuxR C-terminal-related transcriptional regulator [Thiomicrorhabdus sp. Kp2]
MNVVRFSLGVFIILFLTSFVDILYDWDGMGGLNAHILVEMFMGLMSLIAFGVLLFTSWRQKQVLQKMGNNLTQAQEALDSAQHQSKKLMGEFSKIIQTQFDLWNFTQSEKEVALLLLKGLTLDEIASVRETKEKTVRQQASNLYKKAGISGRHELVAFFFEDLLI